MVRSTNILVGVHGAGLMHIMFAAEEVCMCIRIVTELRGVCVGGAGRSAPFVSTRSAFSTRSSHDGEAVYAFESHFPRDLCRHQ